MNPNNNKTNQKTTGKFKVAFQFFNTLLPTIAALGLQFLTFIITARGLGVEQFGIYTTLLAIVGVSQEIVGLGGSDLLVRAVSRDTLKFKAYFGNMLINILITLPFVVILGTFLAFELMHVELEIPIICVALLGEILIARISASLELIMVAHGNMVRSGFIRMITVIVRLIAAWVYFLYFNQHDLEKWIDVIVCQSILLGFFYIFLAAYLYGSPTWKWLLSEQIDGLAFCVNQTTRAAQSNLDRMILSRFADNAAMGVYGAASRVLQLGLFPIQIATRILYPKFFIHGVKGIVSSRRFALRVSPILALVGILSGLGIAFAAALAPDILGESFSNITYTAERLAFAMPFIALQYPAADALTGAGRQWLRVRLYGIMTISFGFILIAGVHFYGADGLITGFVLGHLIFACVLWISVFLCYDQPIEPM